VIRRIEIGDAQAVASIARAGRFGAIPGLPDLHTPADDRELYRSQIESKSGWVWVDDEGSVVGFVIWLGAFIDHLYVDPEHQRSGIGTGLLDAAVAEMGVPEVRLWTFQANERAVAFYSTHGFRVREATDGSATEERLPDYLLVSP
jgi:ribosomal protein S18 acetylase RimI-like enzyme